MAISVEQLPGYGTRYEGTKSYFLFFLAPSIYFGNLILRFSVTFLLFPSSPCPFAKVVKKKCNFFEKTGNFVLEEESGFMLNARKLAFSVEKLSKGTGRGCEDKERRKKKSRFNEKSCMEGAI